MDSNPYLAPLSAPTNSTGSNVPGIKGPYGAFRQNGRLKTALVSLLVIDAMMSIFNSGVLNLLDIQQQNSDEYWLTDGPSKLDEIITLTGSLHMVVIFSLIIIFSAWINRSCKNGWLLDAPHMKTTPRLSVGYFFIPLLSLWKPYGAMKEIRRASHGNDNALRSILPLWWTFWLTSNVLAHIIFKLYTNSEDQESYLMACKLDLVSVPVDVTLNYLAIALVTSITLAQQRRAAQWKI